MTVMHENTMILKSDKVVPFDVDKTLIFKSEAPYTSETQWLSYDRGEGKVVNSAFIPHKSQIQLLKYLYVQGHTIIVWSGSGYRWAEAVVKALDLSEYVSLVLSKPQYYVDDRDSTIWMGRRIYRELNDPETD